MRSHLVLALAISAAACATIAGVDGDFHEVDSDASAGGTATGGSDGAVAGGEGGVGGSEGGVAGDGGVGGVGGVGDGGGPTGGSGGNTDGGASCSALGKTCAGTVPATFTGPVIVYESSGTPEACPADYPTEVSSDLHAELAPNAAHCDCNCTTPSITCGTPSAYEHADAACSAGSFLAQMTPGVCKSFVVGAGHRVSVKKPAPTLGSCVPSSNNSIQAPTWGIDARSCATSSVAGECSAGEVCVPPQPSGAKICVYKSGDVSCPAGYYSAKHLFHGDYADTRQCSACSCGSATGGECKGSVVLTNSSCTDASTTVSLGNCSGVVSNVAGGKYTPGTHTPGSCAPNGGLLNGSVNATGPVTYCCAP